MSSDGVFCWASEAAAVIEDIRSHVRSAEVSRKLPASNRSAYINLATLEGMECCVELDCSGYAVVGNEFDAVDVEGNEKFETPYGLLNKISDGYKNSFGNQLAEKLLKLKEEE